MEPADSFSDLVERAEPADPLLAAAIASQIEHREMIREYFQAARAAIQERQETFLRAFP